MLFYKEVNDIKEISINNGFLKYIINEWIKLTLNEINTNNSNNN